MHYVITNGAFLRIFRELTQKWHLREYRVIYKREQHQQKQEIDAKRQRQAGDAAARRSAVERRRAKLIGS